MTPTRHHLSLLRRVIETAAARDIAARIGVYLREVQTDLRPADLLRRGIAFLLRIMGRLAVWDYPASRKLVRTEIVTMSSRITRDISLDSGI